MDRYVRNSQVEAAPMLEETILYSPEAKRFCVLNPTAAYVWEHLATPGTVEVLVSGLRSAFAVDSTADVEADVRSTLRQLEGLSLVKQIGDA